MVIADDVFDRIANLFPRGVERFGSFLPGEFPRPTGQQQHVSFGQVMLAIAPRYLFDHHTAGAALDSAHTVQEKDQ